MKSTRRHWYKSWRILLVCLIVAAAVVILILKLTHTTHWFRPTSSTTIHSTRPSITTPLTNQSSGANPSSSNSSSSTKSTAPVTPSSGAGPVMPTGNFVSNHHPNLSGSPLPSQEASVCITTPGASCYIAFTSGGVTKKLDTQTADSNGAVYWNWDVKQAGFTADTWQVTAYASLNGKSASAQDSQTLVVQP